MVSEILGEMLKLAIVVTLVAVLGMSVYSHLPDERVPSLEIEMRFNDTNSSFIDLVHVGGDPIRTSEMKIEIINTSNSSDMVFYSLTDLTNSTYWKFPETISMDTRTSFSDNLTSVKMSVIHPRKVMVIAEVSLL